MSRELRRIFNQWAYAHRSPGYCATTMSDPLPWLTDELRTLGEAGLLRRRRTVAPLADGWCTVDGQRLRNFAANDYLNLAHDPRVIAAAREALEAAGAGARASALVSGRTQWHAQLEQTLAEFEGTESALLFPSGYAANVGTITALAGAEDAVYCDRFNHASLVDGCRLSGAAFRVYRHDDIDRLERELRTGNDYRRRWIVSDALFSMDGDIAPLLELCHLAERYDAPLILDEAHGTGVFGRNGRGVAEEIGVEERVAVRIGTLSKGVGSLGGFVAGSQMLVDWLWNRARTAMFSTALPPAACAAATAAVEIIRKEPERRTRLKELSNRFRDTIRSVGIETPQTAVGPIVPIVLHDPHRAVAAAEQLEMYGFLVAAIRPPTVPQGTSRLRITLSCAHTQDDVDQLASALRQVLLG
jgi:8-amino-7-oxononanoate synthase